MKAAALALITVVVGVVTPSSQEHASPARMSKASNASEYWDLMARFDTGHRLVARFLITNEGPGAHTALALGHLIHPDGTTTKFQNGRRRSRWQIDDEKLKLAIGSSSLDLRRPQRRFAVDNDKRGIKIFVDLQADTAEAGGQRELAGYRVDPLDLSVPAAGSVWTRGMEAPVKVNGRASLVHTWMDESESELALRRFDFASLDERDALLFYDLTTPGGERTRWLSIERAGRILYESGDLEVSLRGVAAQGSERDYPIPAALHFENSEVAGRFELGTLLVSLDPLDHLPQPFRMLLSFKSRPRRVWAESPFEVKLNAGADRSSIQVRGTGIASVTYLNPLRSP